MTMRSLLTFGAFAALVLACSSGSGGGGNGNGSSSGGGSGSSGGSSGSSGGSSGSSGGSSGSSGGSGSSSGSSGSSGGSSGSGGEGGAYPSGPYGVAVGDVIPNMQWIGYEDDQASEVATMEPYAAYTLLDAYNSGKHYAMINLAETDCPGCQKSAGELENGSTDPTAPDAKTIVGMGGVVIEVLETTGFTTQASQTDLEAWVNKYELPCTTVKDPDGTGTVTLNTLGHREQAYIVDLTTMKILQVIEGDETGLGATSGGKALAAMQTLL
jgi:hypothetical protein